ncbi:SDR family oxidoreductase [Pseudofrankia saprophytica]|uniref:SDR family oxidoreductase n=1 Tax=Pseudofrankia saprophytica TaxID=298655 RepID=UPI000234CDE2|nr:NAD(P)H-binding protein [Pseudofrankia saprophytica]
MRVAVVGATGRIGRLTSEVLRDGGHEVVDVARSLGVDVLTGEGLDKALDGVAAVIDCSNTPAQDVTTVVDFFTTTTANLLAAEQRAGVGHHVPLSIVGMSEPPANAHYAGKLAQETTVERGPVPWTIVRATQFHDFAAMVASWTERDGTAVVAPLLMQPIAPADVAAVLAETAVGEPRRERLDIAGPETQDLVDMARRTYAARGREIRLVPTWEGVHGLGMAGNAMLPGAGARIMPTTFDAWLAAGAR